MFLQLFNLVNCRKIGISDTNVFEKIFTHNWIFLLVLILCFVLQYFFVNVLYDLIGAVKITKSEWGACLFIGSTELLAAFALKFTPSKWVDFDISGVLDEDNSEKSRVVGAF
jgi:hypothetical protein